MNKIKITTSAFHNLKILTKIVYMYEYTQTHTQRKKTQIVNKKTQIIYVRAAHGTVVSFIYECYSLLCFLEKDGIINEFRFISRRYWAYI